MSLVRLDARTAASFPEAARSLLRETQLRKNVAHATDVIQRKRALLVAEKQDWQALRESAEAIRRDAMERLGDLLVAFEARCQAAGGEVHWARDAEEARAIVVRLAKAAGSREVIKIKSMTTAEIDLNAGLEAEGFEVFETDLAELILQLSGDQPSHIVVPALHQNRQQVREIFAAKMGLPGLSDDPRALAEAARGFLRRKFLSVKTAVCGANFLIAETGSVCVVESEGNGRMCLTMPETLIAVAGVEKVLPRYRDLEVMLQLLARSATGERLNPYNSLWTGVMPGDGPKHFHVVLVDNGRTRILADDLARQTLHCIRCGACQNACPVYRQTGGHAYGSVYAGPIGAILTPQLMSMEHGQSLPYASSLCGACYEVCPVRINIPEMLIYLRSLVVAGKQEEWGGSFSQEALGMRVASTVFRSGRRLQAAQRLARMAQTPLKDKQGWIHWLPGMGGQWTATRDLPAMAQTTFREWWQQRRQGRGTTRGAER